MFIFAKFWFDVYLSLNITTYTTTSHTLFSFIYSTLLLKKVILPFGLHLYT